MPRSVKTHLDGTPEMTMTPKNLSKQEFGQRVYTLMLKQGWNQSELARQADLPRDAVSTYVRGLAFPTPVNLEKLAAALGVTASDLLPNRPLESIGSSIPSLDIRVSPQAPNMAWVQVNRLCSLSTAVEIIRLINMDHIEPSEAS
jgi:transcriptional regulator with XRE-family HTH domain